MSPHLLREHIREATPRRSLWEPRHAPMTARDYIGATILAAFAAAVFLLLWVGVPK